MREADLDRSDSLLLAVTRPALVYGVPFEALAGNVLVCFLSSIELSGPGFYRTPFMFWLAAIPIHLVLRRLTDWDYHWARTLFLWGRAGYFYGRLEAIPSRRPTSGKRIASSV